MERDPPQLRWPAAQLFIEHQPPLSEEAGGVHLLAGAITKMKPPTPGAESPRPGKTQRLTREPQPRRKADAYFLCKLPWKYEASFTSSWMPFCTP